ncbi:MAG TPA: hypothetical protein VNE82_16845 [Candidatus Binataceae bacterium]|nr:hypothetical protein [Candidatus Binataceae bacterium]
MNYFTGRFVRSSDGQKRSALLLTMAFAGVLMASAAADARTSTTAMTMAQYSGYSNGMAADGQAAVNFTPDSGFSTISPSEIDIAVDGPLYQGDAVTLYWTATYTDGSTATSGGTMFLTAAEMSAAGGSIPFELFPFAFWQAAVTSGKAMQSFSVQAAGAPEATVIVAIHGMEYQSQALSIFP